MSLNTHVYISYCSTKSRTNEATFFGHSHLHSYCWIQKNLLTAFSSIFSLTDDEVRGYREKKPKNGLRREAEK